MYEQFYGFGQSPFTLAPDPRFLYLSDSHDDAIRRLLQSIRRKEGFIVLSGDIGTGKTTLCRALIEQFDPSTFTSLVLNPYVSIDQLLKEILLDFGLVSREAIKTGRLAQATTHELISTLHEFLLSIQPLGGTAVLIIDEAQHVPPAVLEQLRVMSNLETNSAKLQIVLVGQLDLLTVLGESGMRQLDQRISLRAMLRPLTRIELEAYVGHRLDVGRASSSVSFDAAALDLIHAHSGGVPRLINRICDRALMVGAEAGSHTLTAGIVRQGATALGLTPARTPAARRVASWAITVATVVSLGIASLAGVVMLTPPERIVTAPAPARPASPTPVRVAPGVPTLPPPETTPPLYPRLPVTNAPAPVAVGPITRASP